MPEKPQSDNHRALLLTQEFRRICYASVAGLLASALLLGFVWQWSNAAQWLVQASIIWSFICFQTQRRLLRNRGNEEAPLYDQLGLANRLTLLRAWLIAGVGGFLFQAWPENLLLAWLPGMLYLFAAVLDRVDGFVARSTGQFSLLGEELDTVSDALGLAVASVLAFGYGQIHWTYLLVGVAYYVFNAGLLWRKSRGLEVYPLPPAFHRRAWAGFQMGFLVVALWPLFFPPITKLAGFAFMMPVLLGFLSDWLYVSGRISQPKQQDANFGKILGEISHSVLQPLLRVTVVGFVVVSIMQSGLPLLPGSGAAVLSNFLMGGLVLSSAMVLFGIAGRYFSLLLMGMLAWYFSSNAMLWNDYFLFCAVIWVLLLGTGRYSLWLEDDRWLNSYDGA